MSLTAGCEQLTPLLAVTSLSEQDTFSRSMAQCFENGLSFCSGLFVSSTYSHKKYRFLLAVNWKGTHVKTKPNVHCSEHHCVYQLSIYLIDSLLNFT